MLLTQRIPEMFLIEEKPRLRSVIPPLVILKPELLVCIVMLTWKFLLVGNYTIQERVMDVLSRIRTILVPIVASAILNTPELLTLYVNMTNVANLFAIQFQYWHAQYLDFSCFLSSFMLLSLNNINIISIQLMLQVQFWHAFRPSNVL